MIRLSAMGGVRLHSFARSIAVGVVLLVPLTALAAGSNYTDRIIVKYRAMPATAAVPSADAKKSDVKKSDASKTASTKKSTTKHKKKAKKSATHTASVKVKAAK